MINFNQQLITPSFTPQKQLLRTTSSVKPNYSPTFTGFFKPKFVKQSEVEALAMSFHHAFVDFLTQNSEKFESFSNLSKNLDSKKSVLGSVDTNTMMC